MSNATTAKPVIIIGAGWAGLSAAFSLANRGIKSILLEAGPKAGGRARSIRFGLETVDNGQHLCMGAYTEMLALAKALKIPEEQLFTRLPFELLMMDLKSPQNLLVLKLAKHTSISSSAFHLLKAQGLSIGEKISLLRFFYQLPKIEVQRITEYSTQEFLIHYKQSDYLIRHLWEPLALAALSTPINKSSACVFVQILKSIFFTHSAASNFLFPKQNLSQTLPQPILNFLSQKNNAVFYHQRAQSLSIQDANTICVKTAKQSFEGRSLILATPPAITAQLLKTIAIDQLNPLIQQLSLFSDQPIGTLYLRFSKPLSLSAPLIGLVNGLGDWIIHRRHCGQAHILSVVITGSKALPFNPKTAIPSLMAELRLVLPYLDDPLESRWICEKKAVFSCEVGIQPHRPLNHTPIANLFLAGDYTQNPYAATLESAVYSGKKAAELLY